MGSGDDGSVHGSQNRTSERLGGIGALIPVWLSWMASAIPS